MLIKLDDLPSMFREYNLHKPQRLKRFNMRRRMPLVILCECGLWIKDNNLRAHMYTSKHMVRMKNKKKKRLKEAIAKYLID